jgi:hypothetical protein
VKRADLLDLLAGAVLGYLADRALTPTPKGWDVLEGRQVHVTPCGDWIEHNHDGLDCICGPTVEFHERPLVVHMSLDGREAHEG